MAQKCPTGQHDVHNVYQEHCPCRALLDLLASKWSALIIGLLEDRADVRFSELQAALPGVGPKMLTQTLRRLEAASLINRKVYAEVPPRTEYSLTVLGKSVAGPLAQIRLWAEDHIDEIDALNPAWMRK
jgi:DNA-binding HxlR family transcriptional regulator